MNQPLAAMTGQTGSGPFIQRLRLWSGLTLFAYVCSHYFNHALGHISLGAMEAMLHWHSAVVASIPGQVVLYSALCVHVALGLWKLASIRTWRLPFWEWAQVLFGIAIPWFLVSHITYTRGAETLLGVEVNYEAELLLLWPGAWISQSLLLVIVWVHACIGLHFWLRTKNGYQRWFAPLAGLATIIPALGLTGWIVAARREYDRLQLLAQESPEGLAAWQERRGINNALINALDPLDDALKWSALAIISGFALFMVARWITARYRARINIRYSGGPTVSSAAGHTLLEISRANGIPHMSVCGGRARCSTCRTLVLTGEKNLSEPGEAELNLLSKFNAGPGVRLACQAVISGDVEIRPLIQPQASSTVPRDADPLGWGVEREVVVFFLDIRGFSRISEHALPYDIVYILNSFFAEAGRAVENAGGYIDKFMGDGMMAVFGLKGSANAAARNALRAAIGVLKAAEKSSGGLKQHLTEPLRIGVGIHAGQAVIGRIGKTSDQTTPSRLTAIGATVNVAARLEASTKELDAPLVISAHLLELTGISLESVKRARISVRNISEPVEVAAISNLESLQQALDASRPALELQDDGPDRIKPRGLPPLPLWSSLVADRLGMRNKKTGKQPPL